MRSSTLPYALLLCAALLTLPAPAAASSQVAVVLFFCCIAAVVPGPWQQPLQFISSQKDTLVPELSLFALRLLLMILAATVLQKVTRCNALKFASLSLYVIPAMSLALLVDQAHRQPWIDALSLASTANMMYKACSTCLLVMPPAYLETFTRILQLPLELSRLFQRWSTGENGGSEVNTDDNTAVLLLPIASALALLLFFRIFYAAFIKCIASVDSITLQAVLFSQLYASFFLSRVPDLRSAFAGMLCVVQLLIAPYLRYRSLPFPTAKNRRLFILCVMPIAMAYSSQGVELSVFIQVVLDIFAMFATAVKMAFASDSPNLKRPNRNRMFCVFLMFGFVVILTILDCLHFRIALPYIAELLTFSYRHTFQPDLTFISMFVVSWCANYDAGFPSLLVVVMTILLPSIKG